MSTTTKAPPPPTRAKLPPSAPPPQKSGLAPASRPAPSSPNLMALHAAYGNGAVARALSPRPAAPAAQPAQSPALQVAPPVTLAPASPLKASSAPTLKTTAASKAEPSQALGPAATPSPTAPAPLKPGAVPPAAGAQPAPAQPASTAAEPAPAASPTEAPAVRAQTSAALGAKAAPGGAKVPAGGPGGTEGGAEARAPDARTAIAPAITAVHQRAFSARKHAAPGVAVASAQAAAVNPQVEQKRAAATQTVAALDAAKAEEVKRSEFKAKLKKAIEEATPKPKTKEEAEKVMKTGAAQASGTLRGQLAAERDTAAGPLKSAAATEVPPSSQPAPPAATMQSEPVGPPPAPVSAAPVVPAPLPVERLDYSADRGPTEQVMAENNLTQEQMQKANDPAFGPTLAARSAAEKHEAAAPASYRQAENKVQDQAHAVASQALAKDLAGIHGIRGQQIGKVVSQQIGTQGKDAQERQRITDTITGIKNKTRADVENILASMQTGADATFERGLKRAETAYEKAFEEAKGGIGTWLTTWGSDWDKHIERALATARASYMREVDAAIDEVAALVEGKLAAAKQRVADGRKEVEAFVSGLDASLRQHGEEALQAVSADFDAMGSEIDQRRDDLISKLADQYRSSYERMTALETKFRSENKSLWQRVYDATVGLVKQLKEFWNMLMTALARAAGALAVIFKDPGSFFRNLTSAVKQGFHNFSSKIGFYLEQGLMGWLFGALEGAGIELPKSFDMKGILHFIMQVLGLTYANIRARAVKIVGEKVVSAMETTVEIFKKLITEGPGALWEWIKEKIGDLKQAVLGSIKEWLISKIITAGITWIISLLNPVSGIFKIFKAIYDIVMFFVERAKQIIALVNAVVDAVIAIAKGSLSAAASFVENALAKSVPLVIGLLAALLGLGGISDTVRKFIEKVRAPINAAIDWVINLAVKGVKAAGKLFAGLTGKTDKSKDDKTPETKDPQHDAKVAAGLAEIDRGEASAAGSDRRLSYKEAQKVAATVKQDNPVFKSIKVVNGGETWNYEYEASPAHVKHSQMPKQSDEGTEKPENWDEVQKVVGKKVGVNLPNGYSYYVRDGRKYIRRDVADDKKFQRIGVDPQEIIVLGAGISPAEALRSEAEMKKELGPAEAGKERHHLIPLSVAASHQLVKKAMESGKPPYPPNSGLIYLPKDEEAAKKMPGLPIHSGSHPKWSVRVFSLLTAALTELILAFGALDKVPGEVLTEAVIKVRNRLGIEISGWKRME